MRDEKPYDAVCPQSPAPRATTLALAAIACVAVEAAVPAHAAADHPRAFMAAAAVCIAIVLVVAEFLRRVWPDVAATPHTRTPLLCGLVCGAVAVEYAVCWAVGSPPLLDALLLTLLRDAVIVLALFSHHAGAARVCVALAVMLVVFASASVTVPWIQWLVAGFALVGIWWLMGHHWLLLQPRLQAAAQRPLPRRWLVTLPVGVCAFVLLVPAAGRGTRALDGFMPTSGGRRDSSPEARSGVGDGEALVAGRDNIRSFAPIEDAPFMTSHEPTLYDVFDDTYNEPVVRKKTERAIGLPPQTPVRPEDHSAARSSRPGREFSLIRQAGRPGGRRIRDLESQALFYVKGRVPLHLKVESFALFDGVEWRPEELGEHPPRLSMERVQGRPWLRIERSHAYDFFAPPETHAIKVVGLDTNRIPAPNELLGMHIDEIAEADFYRWAQPDVVRLDRDKLPGMLEVHLQSRCADPRLLISRQPPFVGGPEECMQFGSDPDSLRVRSLAESWVAGVPRGWRQIERVVERVRQEHVLDPEARIAPESGHAVADFLFETKRGPDYLFAAATAWSLRSLGYATRLVGGFHADPRRYDRRADHTPVLAADVHVWVEVHVSLDHWAPLEPTPGYRLLAPPLTTFEWLAKPVEAAAGAVVSHPVATAILAAAIAIALRGRRRIADACDELWGRAWPGRDERESMIRLLAMLDRRCARLGLHRPAHATPARWLADVLAPCGSAALPQIGAVEEFLALADQALYAPRFPNGRGDVRRLVRDVWSWRNLATVAACRVHGRSPEKDSRR
jgi:transglutaminase-like putative cysteine protease